ncbi:MAG TPA: hypothetical protein VI299_24390, partial [Polyangiales bacterium]
ACVCIAGYQASKEGCVPVPPDAGESDAGGGTDSGSPSAPTGVGTACTSQADCASFDADFCLPFPGQRFCAVRNCASGEHRCPSDRVCCDVSFANTFFTDLTMANGLCITSAGCAMGGKVVTP